MAKNGRKKAADVPAFPDMQNQNARTADSAGEAEAAGPGLKKCECVAKHFRNGVLVKPGAVRYFATVPEHFEEAE